MERRAPRIKEMRQMQRQRHELSCMWGLSSVIESCHSRTGRKLISNARPINKQTIDYPRKLKQRARFDGECRRIQLQNEADLESAGDMPFEKYNTKQNIVKGHGQAKSDSEFFNLFVETHKRAKGNSRETYQSSLFCLENNELSSASADISLDGRTLAAVLTAVCSQNHGPEDSVRTSAKAFADQMFIHKQLVSRNRSLSNALAKTEKETVKSILEAGECEGLESSSSFEKARNAFVGEKGKMDGKLRRNSSEAGFVARSSEKIVILKRAKYSENVTCHCSSLQSHKKQSKKVLDANHTSFSFREMKRKLKHTFGGLRKEPSESSNVETAGNLHHELDIKSRWGYDSPGKSDSSCVRILSSKEDFNVILEAKKHLSARFNNLNTLETVTNEKNSWKTLARILASPERDTWPISPTRDRQHGSGSAQMSFSPYNDSPTFRESNSKIRSGRERASYSPTRTKNEVYEKYGSNSVLIPITDQQEHDIHSDDTKSNGKSKIVEMDSSVGSQLNYCEVPSEINNNGLTRTIQRTERKESQKADENDSLSENEASTSTVNDGIKYQDEHQSPISVLEPFFIEDANSPLSVTLHNDKLAIRKSGVGRQLKPHCLDFKKCSFESSSLDPQIDANSCMHEQDHLSQYVHLVLHASCLNWDQLSEIMSPDEELLDSFLFDEVEFLSPTDCYFDPKLLFDRINEVLLEIYECHLRFPQWQSFAESKIRSGPLAELVIDEIMKEADVFLLPWTENRTWDQLVLNDVAKCRSWMSDARVDTEEIVTEISEGFLDGFILDVLVEFHT